MALNFNQILKNVNCFFVFVTNFMQITVNVIYTLSLIIYYLIESIVITFVPNRFKMKDVSDETVLITGGGNGIGRQLAIKFARRGCKVIIWDVDTNGLAVTCKLIHQFQGKCWSFECDIRDRKQVYSTADRVREQVGSVTLLVNNAGVADKKLFLDKDDESIVKTMEINVHAHFWTCKAFLPEMMANNRGHIVSIASLAGYAGIIGLTDYCASKFAVVGFTESLRMELIARNYDGIKVTEISPYFLNTKMFAGVKSKVFPILKCDTVCERILFAILCNKTVTYIPFIFQPLLTLKSIIPVDSIYHAYKLLGVSDAVIEVKKNGEILNSNGPKNKIN
ncbi:epidermal retinol dehydrogenase 2-like protein [Leptotrombidium deliense]|uniref:Short-chain dehydrogenase/reductase 3 n=1 Tax=Leptotrombidium deliense TaxID=299467 RepID=A0A443SG02_9ACAR|nr:epidermal retinol dehydrogenase 2-like protein [Leptotrombidium deliense]